MGIEYGLKIKEAQKYQPNVWRPAVVAILGKQSHVAVYILTLLRAATRPNPHLAVAEQDRKRRHHQQQIQLAKDRKKQHGCPHQCPARRVSPIRFDIYVLEGN